MAGLIDMEELIERVRSASAKSYIQEAVGCYKAGAYRSCIVATWIALIYDFVEKFRDLALSGDAGAKTLVAEFDRIHRDRDTSAALKFERDVLDIAKDEYELLSPQEHVDLKRLFEDRNRYGHPNINQDAEALNATAELARLHLRNAVEHVMQRPPVQGKSALLVVQAAVDSPYFPLKADDAVASLSGGPLARAKKALIRDFFLGCVISLLREKPAAQTFERRCAAAIACRRMHGQVVDEVIDDKAQGILEKTKDDSLGYLLVLLVKIPELQRRVSASLKIRLKSYMAQLPERELAVVNFGADIEFLKSELIERLESVTPAQLQSFVQGAARSPARPVIERAIEMLEVSKSWDSSNAVCSVISERMLDGLLPSDAERLLVAVSNNEVKWSFNHPGLIVKLVERQLLPLERARQVAEAEEATTLITALEKFDF